MSSLNYLEPCWCKCLDPSRGKKVNRDNASQVRNGMPLCNNICAEAYDTRQEQRAAALELRQAVA